MAKPEWGTKRLCQSCATKFYDFGRSPIVCPKCGSEFDPESVLKSRRRAPAKPAKPVKPAKVAPVEEEEAELEDGEDGEDEDIALDDETEDADSVIEDTSDLGDDEDVADVVVDEDDED